MTQLNIQNLITNDDNETLELEIGEYIYWEYESDEFRYCEVIGVNTLLNQVQVLYYPSEESKIKLTKWVDANDVYKEDELLFMEGE